MKQSRNLPLRHTVSEISGPISAAAVAEQIGIPEVEAGLNPR